MVVAELFRYHPDVIGRYPTIRAGLVHATGLANGASPPELVAEYLTEQHAVVARLADTPIAELPSIAAWRRAFAQFGVKPTQYRAAAEALLRRLSKQGDIPSINTLVDMGNLISIRYAMPVAVFDQAGIARPTTVQFATGEERFTDLGSSEAIHPSPGEVVFVDRDNVVSARRWCWRQSAQSATGPTTVDALIVIEGHHEAAADEIEAALADITGLLARYQPACDYSMSRLSAASPGG
jgi:DNA/RNA-binding domain of Phe-tRNA-synthetase-like protein